MHEEQLIKQLPKIDLYRHLEGVVRPHTFFELVKEKEINLPNCCLEEYMASSKLVNENKQGLTCFKEVVKSLNNIFTDKEALVRIAAEAVEDAIQDNIKYLELRFNPFKMINHRIKWDDIIDSISQGIAIGKRENGIEVRLICQIDSTLDLCLGERVINFAIRDQDKGIVGLELLGVFLPEKFVYLCKKAVNAGLGITLYAGEAEAENINELVQLLGIRRLSHVSKLEQNAIIFNQVFQERVMLEVCLTSLTSINSETNSKKSLLEILLRNKILFSLNSDKPTIYGTTLTQEYIKACAIMGFSIFDLQQIILSTIDFIFDEELKDALQGQFVQEFNIWNRLV